MGTSTPARQSRFPLPALLAGVVLLLCAQPVFPATSQNLRITIQSIEQSQPPLLLGNVVIFTYKPEAATRHVGARFAGENYAVLHDYSRNENGVFVLGYPLSEGIKELRYRIVVDGLWMNDPANPNTASDAMGNLISVYTLEAEPAFPTLNPRFETDGRITLEYHGLPGQRVFVMGDFNDWDPSADLLSEIKPGVYRIALSLLPGDHYYVYFSLGRKILDPFNPEAAVDPDGGTVSHFRVP